MQESNNTIRNNDQTLVMVRDMRDNGMSFGSIAEAFNDAGLIKPVARNAYTHRDIEHMMYNAYPRMLKRKAIHPDQVIDMNKLFMYVGRYFTNKEKADD